jgi:hypothetical protein
MRRLGERPARPLHADEERLLRHLANHAIGGWVVRDGSSQYAGCLVKGSKRRCAPNGDVYNNGAIGAN